MKSILFCIFLLLPINFTFASNGKPINPLSDVDPISKLGILRIETESVGYANHRDYTITIQTTKGTSINEIDLSKNYKIEEQDFCLKINPLKQEIKSGKFCGYKIKRGQTLTIKLGGFKVTSENTYLVSVGPMMEVKIYFEDVESSLTSILTPNHQLLERLDFNWYYMAPLGNIKVEYIISDINQTQKKFSLTKGSDIFNITPKDLRNTLNFRILETPKNNLRNELDKKANLGVVSLRAPNYLNGCLILPPKAETPVTEVMPLVGTNDQPYLNLQKKLIVWKNLVIDQASDIVLKVFQLQGTTEPCSYTLDINGYSIPLVLNQTIELEPINVNHFDNDVNNGFFHIVRYFPNHNGEYQLLNYIKDYNKFSTERSNLPTKSSVMVPRGYLYQVRTFIKDEAGNLTPQSTHDVDLR